MTDSDEAFRPMSKGFVKDYTDLLAYQTSFQLSKEIFETTKQFPKDEIRLLEIGRLLKWHDRRVIRFCDEGWSRAGGPFDQ